MWPRATLRQVSVSLISVFLFVCATSSTRGEGGVSATKNRSATSGKALKYLQTTFKSPSETAWEKGVASITPEALDDETIVETLSRFVNREISSERFSSALVRAISKLADAKQECASQAVAASLNANDFRVVMSTADIVSAAQDRGYLDRLIKLSDRREFPARYGFRRCVVDAVARYRDKTAVDFLVEQLEKSDGQLKYETALNLQRLTGQEFGGMTADWKSWWQSHRDDFVFASRVQPTQSVVMSTPPKQIPWEESRPSFYGMTIYAKRVVFVIDRSGSMSSSVYNETRLQRAQQELQKSINALTESDQFNIVAFDDQMEVFQRKLVPANAVNKDDGVRFAYGLEPRGATACYEPLKMGLEACNDLELILFLSDGEPTAGALVEPSAIVIAIANHNMTQRTTIHTLGIDARDKHESFLKGLAEKNFGKLLLLR